MSCFVVKYDPTTFAALFEGFVTIDEGRFNLGK